MNKKFADGEVFQRLLKSADAVAFFAGGLLVTLLAVQNTNAATPATTGFFVLLLGFLCLYVLRGLGQYKIDKLANGFLSAVKSWVATAIIGGLLYQTSALMHLQLSPFWIKMWLARSESVV